MYDDPLSCEARQILIVCEFVDEERDRDIHDKSSVREVTSKDKEYATRRSIFNINKKRQASLEEDDTGARKSRKERRSEERSQSPLIGEELVCNKCKVANGEPNNVVSFEL